MPRASTTTAVAATTTATRLSSPAHRAPPTSQARFKIDVVGAGTAIEFVKEQQGVLVLLVTRAAPLYVMLEASEYPTGQQHYLIHLGDRVIKRGHEDAFELGRTDNDDGGTELVVTLMVEAQATVAPEEGGDSQSSDGWC